jgi:CBS domain-containing protein
LQAATIMRTKHVGDVVVVDDGSDECTPVGIVTDRDIVVKVLGNEVDARRVTLGEIMRTPVIVGNHNEEVSDVIPRMRAQRVRRLPVVGPHGRLIGIVTLDDLLRRMMTDANALLEIVASEQDQEQRTLR